MPKKKPNPIKRFEDELPIIFETFNEHAARVAAGKNWDSGAIKQPYCFNGMVGVRRYRITVELIEESSDVIFARLQELWDQCDNHHNWMTLQAAASRIGKELKGSPGTKRKK